MSDAEELSGLITSIYDASIDSTLWPATLEGIRDFVGGCAANFYWQEVSKESAGVFHCVGIGPTYLDTYFTTYTKLNPLYPAAAFVEPGKVFDTAEVIPRPEFVRTRFYAEWMRPQGMVNSLVVNLEKSVTSIAALAVIRGNRDGVVDEDAKCRMRLVAPHMLRALSIGNAVAGHERANASLIDAFDRIAAGVFLVAASGRVVFANVSARALSVEGKWIREGPRGLVATNSDADRALQHALAISGRFELGADSTSASILLGARQTERWLAHVLPLTSGARRGSGVAHSAVAMVFVRKASLDIPSPLETVARLFRLTGTEVRVLHEIVDTGGIPDIAATLGISKSTVRTHVKRLFEKTSTHRQADLVKLVAAHASPFS